VTGYFISLFKCKTGCWRKTFQFKSLFKSFAETSSLHSFILFIFCCIVS